MLRAPLPWLAAGALLAAAGVSFGLASAPEHWTRPAPARVAACPTASAAARAPAPVERDELSERYAQVLARAWSDDPIAAFDALREARGLDLALGGRQSEVLQARMSVVAPFAAAAFEAAGDRDAARLATESAEMARP